MMRYLHAVGLHETFVSSGVFGVEEWNIHQLPDGMHLIRADFDGRARKENSVLVEALMDPDTLDFERIDTHIYHPDGRLFKDSYTFFDGYIQNAYSFDKGERQYDEIPLEQGQLLAPPSNILNGFFVAKLALIGGELSCLFAVGYDDNKLIEQHTCAVSLVGQSNVNGKSANEYHFSGFPDDSIIWLDDHHIKIKEGNTMLKRYARRG